MPDDPVISHTIKRALEVTGLGKTKLYELINSGELPVVEVDDRTLVVLDEDLRALLFRRRVTRGNGGDSSTKGLPAALEKKLGMHVAEFGFSTRASNALLNDDVIYLGQLVQKSEQDLIRTPNIGAHTVGEIKAALGRHKLRLEMKFAADWRPPADPDRMAESDHEKLGDQ